MRKKVLFLAIVMAILVSGCGSKRGSEGMMSLGGGGTASVEDAIAEGMGETSDTEDDAKASQSITETKQQNNSNSGEKKTETPQQTAKTGETQKNKDNKLEFMSASEKKEVNMFLSNFSEAGYRGAKGGVSENAAKISFAFTHLEINEYDKVIYNDLEMGISAEDADRVLERFFGETVPHETPEGSEWTYKDGYFMMSAATGESRAYFSVATFMKDNNDGTFNIDFNVYHDSENPQDYPNAAWYTLSDEQAKAKFKKVGSGTAVVEPVKYNGSNTYQIVYYKEN